MDYNYFEVLELSIDDIQDEDEATIKKRVNDAHTKQYAQTIGAYANMPRSDGLTQAQWQKVLNDAKETLLDPRKRRKHIATLTEEAEVLEEPVLTFPGGEEARSLADLATLMEQHATHAADALYTGTLAQNLRSLDQHQFADAAKTIVDRFSDDRDTGRTAMVAVLHGEVRMEKGKGANTPKQLAHLIDRNWDQAKTLLYNGFFAFWLAHIEQQQLADTANEVTNRYSDEQDIALETFVQALHPRVGQPEPDISQSEIHFNAREPAPPKTIRAETKGTANPIDTGPTKTIRAEIKNVGRGFLYGDVQLKNDVPGLQLADTNIQGEGIVSLHLDESVLTSKEAYRTALVIDTNGRDVEVPIYINQGLQPLLRWAGISGALMAVFAFLTRLIVVQGLVPLWAGTFILGISIYAYWLIVKKSFSWQRFLMPIMPIKNFFHSQHYPKLIEVLIRICKFCWTYIKWINIRQFEFVKSRLKRIGDFISDWQQAPYEVTFSQFIVGVFQRSVGLILLILGLVVLFGLISGLIGGLVATFIERVVSLPFVALAFISTSIFTVLDKLFHLGFNIPIVVGWAFWGLIIGLAIQGYRAMEIYDQKRMKLWVAVAPILLLSVMGTIRYVSHVSASNSPSTETAPIAAQGTAGSETETITREAPDPGATKQPPTESDGGSMLSEEPVSTIGQEAPVLPPTTPRQPPADTPKQETTAIPTLEPEPTTPSGPSESTPIKQTAIEAEEKSIPSRTPVSAIKQEAPGLPPPTTPSQPPTDTPKQEIGTTPTLEPKPATPSIPFDMILIPAGEFQMGSNDNTDETPVHTVYIDAFYIDKYEVTNAKYKAFIDANPQWRKDQIPSEYHNGNYLKHWNGNNYPGEKRDHPVTYVSWYGAMAYATWTGKRLPTEAEWEKAARGGKSGLKYPWGNTVSNGQANYGNHVGDTTVVGNYAANEYGLYDMTGNVLEWCLDAYYGDFYFSSPRRNPLAGVNTIENVGLVISDFVNVTTSRVARGGAWYNTEVQNIRVAYRNRVSPTLTNVALGFRCAKAVTALE